MGKVIKALKDVAAKLDGVKFLQRWDPSTVSAKLASAFFPGAVALRKYFEIARWTLP